MDDKREEDTGGRKPTVVKVVHDCRGWCRLRYLGSLTVPQSHNTTYQPFFKSEGKKKEPNEIESRPPGSVYRNLGSLPVATVTFKMSVGRVRGRCPTSTGRDSVSVGLTVGVWGREVTSFETKP